ncbi:MAG TPA: hypothetical protein VGU66_02260 [Candidatus Elarobacter sp.]|nr:hypothetical protein [Candidatus Elarobacter sp.]
MLDPLVPVIPGNELPRPIMLATEGAHTQRTQHTDPDRSIRRRQHPKPQRPVMQHVECVQPR